MLRPPPNDTAKQYTQCLVYVVQFLHLSDFSPSAVLFSHYLDFVGHLAQDVHMDTKSDGDDAKLTSNISSGFMIMYSSRETTLSKVSFGIQSCE